MKLSFPIKHWLLTLLAGPVVYHFIELLSAPSNPYHIELQDIYLIVLVFSLFLSLPALGIYYLIYQEIVNRTASSSLSKTILTCYSVISVAVTLRLSTGKAFSTLTLAYSIALVITGIALEMKKDVAPKNQLETLSDVEKNNA